MARQRALIFLCFLLPGFLLSEGAKILAVSLVGGSHYLLMDRISQILQDHGHDVTMLQQDAISVLSVEEKTYQLINWDPPEDSKQEFEKTFGFLIEDTLHDRITFESYLKVMKQLGIQCTHFLRRKDILESLKNENFDLVIVETLNYCSFLVAEKLGKPFVSVLPSSFGPVDFGLPRPVSYVPVFNSLLTDRMDFWGRVKNFLMSFDFSVKEWQLYSQYEEAIREHFPEGSRPVLSHLLLKAELWFINSDFAFEFSQPLLPNTVCIGGIMATSIKPVPQNSIMEAIQHGVPMLGIPCFADQPDNIVRVEAKNLGVSIQLKDLKAETLALKMKQVMEDKRFRSAAVAASIIRRSHPLSPAQRLVGWIDHILMTGGSAHLKPYAFQQPWHEQYLLDVFAFLLLVTLGSMWLCGKLLGMVARWLCGARKLKQV
nr:UDP-glucuronosyltransferase 3A1-like isoform X2 [Dasypus novemcinctus]